ncbi:hypothetical protein QR680_003219 [Steinernema hermaphroditum]|uniref:Uncharacterized protein n=1 Tax=Steinernema hermaphroditum TaxID=289476 RepID=A0AA39LJS4_9BILA|nr:hypothetical protein QR680_003219 [Steinernema hermaphroditum]
MSHLNVDERATLLEMVDTLLATIEVAELRVQADDLARQNDLADKSDQADELLMELKRKMGGLKNDEYVRLIIHLKFHHHSTLIENAVKEHLAQLRVDLENLNSEHSEAMNRKNRVIEELNDSKKELKAKISSVEAKIRSESAAVVKTTNALKKAEGVLAAERKQRKALVASLKDRIKYAEHITEEYR